MAVSNVYGLERFRDYSSLSAILLDDHYCRFMREGRTTVDGITVLDPVHLVPFKAKAYVDLSTRMARGEHVDTRDLRKHKKDVFRLMQLFAPEASAELPDPIRNDMAEFVAMAEREVVPLAQIGIRMSLDEALSLGAYEGVSRLRCRRNDNVAYRDPPDKNSDPLSRGGDEPKL